VGSLSVIPLLYFKNGDFKLIKSAGEGSATAEVFLDDVSQGTVSCSNSSSNTDGMITFQQGGSFTNDMVSHVDYIKVGTGLGEFAPIITTEAASSVTSSGFTGNGTITELGSSDITRRGFCYKAVQ